MRQRQRDWDARTTLYYRRRIATLIHTTTDQDFVVAMLPLRRQEEIDVVTLSVETEYSTGSACRHRK